MPGPKTNEREGVRAVLRHARVSGFKVRPVLDCMGTDFFHCGERVGNGQTMKAVNNMMNAGCRLATLEAVAMGRKFGLSLDQDVLETRPQTRLGIVAFAKGFAEAVNDRALQGGGKIGGRLRSFRIVPRE